MNYPRVQLTRYIKRLFFILSVFSCFFVAQSVHAATLFFSPSSGKFGVGDTITVGAYVNTSDQTINNAEAVINFPTEYLSAVSASQANSVFSLWVQPVTISNGAGTISFNGGVPTPGYTGKSGRILTAVFKVLKTGSATITFNSASVRANDGLGTDILSGAGSATFTLGEVVPPKPGDEQTPPPTQTPPTQPVKPNTPPAPRVTSETHADSTKWYSAKDVKLAWPLPEGITGTGILLDTIPNSTPTVVYTSPISSKEISGVDDGIWYFHVQLRNGNGWGQTGHFRLQIDTKRPEVLIVTEKVRDDFTNPKVQFNVEATDSLSGIDYYEVQVDNSPSYIWRDPGDHVFETTPLDPGRHVLIMKAFDKAGNSLTDSVEFNVATIDAPVITDVPEDPTTGQILFVKGTTYADAQVSIYSQRGREEPQKHVVQSDKDGKFSTFFEEKLDEGVYSVWAEVTLKGVTSEESNKVTLAVQQLTFLKIGSWLVSFLTVIITLFALMMLLLLVAGYAWYRYKQFKNKMKKEVVVVERAIHAAFDELRESTRKQVSTLEKVKLKRDLTREESRILVQLKNQLNAAEKHINSEIEKIEKDME